MENGKRRIKVTPKTRAKIRKVFGVSDVAVFDALKYKTQAPRAERIREMAKKCGGVELPCDE
jgi:hypothetical protein